MWEWSFLFKWKIKTVSTSLHPRGELQCSACGSGLSKAFVFCRIEIICKPSSGLNHLLILIVVGGKRRRLLKSSLAVTWSVEMELTETVMRFAAGRVGRQCRRPRPCLFFGRAVETLKQSGRRPVARNVALASFSSPAPPQPRIWQRKLKRVYF